MYRRSDARRCSKNVFRYFYSFAPVARKPAANFEFRRTRITGLAFRETISKSSFIDFNAILGNARESERLTTKRWLSRERSVREPLVWRGHCIARVSARCFGRSRSLSLLRARDAGICTPVSLSLLILYLFTHRSSTHVQCRNICSF